jgi:hypothetical protein
MPTGSDGAKRLGLRQSSAAFATSPQGKAPGDWRTPRRFAPATAHPVFIVCGAACGMLSGSKMIADCRLPDPRIVLVLVLVLEPLSSFVAAPPDGRFPVHSALEPIPFRVFRAFRVFRGFSSYRCFICVNPWLRSDHTAHREASPRQFNLARGRARPKLGL